MKEKLEQHIYLLFFAVSLVLSVMLFYKLADDTALSKIIMVTSAFAIEVGWLYLWRRKSIICKIVALCFVALSLCANVSFTVGLMKLQYMDVEYNDSLKSEVMTLETEIKTLNDAMSQLKPEFVTARLNLSNRIDELRQIKAGKLTEIYTPTKKTNQTVAVFKDIAGLIHTKPETLMIIFFTAFAVLINAAALLLSNTETKKVKVDNIIKTDDKPISKVYLFGERLFREENQPLNGAVAVGQSMGLTERQARAIFEHLRRHGLVKTDGKRAYPAVNRDEYFTKLKQVV